jgi:ABC-2 type transport system permease protein
LGGAYAAICLFASSLSRNGVVAYVIGFGLLLTLYLMQQAVPLFPSSMQDALGVISPIEHYQLMLRGVIGLDDVVCLLATSGVFLAATVFQLERRRWA